MDFLIADTFTDSLGRLTGDEQKAVKTTAFDLQMNPASPGLQFHKLDKAKDKSFWSVRVNADIRLIVHRAPQSLLLCYVDHHDKAYDWAERRKLEVHPKTGAAQLVEIRETVQEIRIPKYVEVEQPKAPKPFLFAARSDDELLGYGVPQEWLYDVRQATEDTLLIVSDRLPGEAAEALLELATGGQPKPYKIAGRPDPFTHPDAQRRFRIMGDTSELERALEFPWDKWTVFLHPAQRQLVERDYRGPARVSGSAGTGKTIVALHRAAFLARSHPDGRVLLTTFSEALANALRTRLRRLISNEPRLADRIDVHALEAIGLRLYGIHIGQPQLAARDAIVNLIRTAAQEVTGHKFALNFLVSEWEQVVDAWQVESWEAYRDVKRLGRKTRLSEDQRKILWSIFERVTVGLTTAKQITWAGLFTRLGVTLAGLKNPSFDFVVVDESQDLSVAQLRFLAALGDDRTNSLFFAGDLGQRIFQLPFSWRALGVDIRGRARNLHVNYRTSHQIRTQADRLLGSQIADVDENVEDRSNTVSVFNGPPPTIKKFSTIESEADAVGAWLAQLSKDGVAPHEMGVFVRSAAELSRAESALKIAGRPFRILDDNVEPISGQVSISTMHLAKGLEFRAVAVMACDDGIIPLQERIETVTEESDLEEVYNTERHLLYVACTRARDHLLVTAVLPGSEFLDDMGSCP